jgi:hypothetical protein
MSDLSGDAASSAFGAPEEKVIDAETARPLDGTDTERISDAARRSWRSRFASAYVALAVIAGIGIGAFVVLLAKPEAAPAPAWSDWVPTGSDGAKVRQIADHVAARYRLDTGQQLVVALAGPPRVRGDDGTLIEVSAIAVLPDTSKGLQEASDVDIFGADGSLHYILCGLGKNCSIASGEPSEARHTLLRREALELALYTFKYVKNVQSVTVTLPPRKDGQAVPTSVFFRPDDVKPELTKPLTRTLNTATPRIGGIVPVELASINRITQPRLFQAQYQPAQDGSAILILQPLALGA